MYEFFFAFLLLSGVTLGSSMKIVKQGDIALVEMLGKYEGKKLEPGLNFLIPVLEQVAYKYTLREQILEIPPKQCTTLDRVSVVTDFVVYWRITDMEKACYKVENLLGAMMNLLVTEIRTEIAQIPLDDLFTARVEINERLVEELDRATEPWGVKITRVELRDFTIGNMVMNESRKSSVKSVKKSTQVGELSSY